jgi:hypothetical protein
MFLPFFISSDQNNLYIIGFESVCRYLNYTLDLLSKRKIKRQLKAKMVGSLKVRFYCQKICESLRKKRLLYSIIVTINVLHVFPSTNEPFV